MADFVAGLVCFILLVLFASHFITSLTDSPNREGSENDYGTYYDGCTDPMIAC